MYGPMTCCECGSPSTLCALCSLCPLRPLCSLCSTRCSRQICMSGDCLHAQLVHSGHAQRNSASVCLQPPSCCAARLPICMCGDRLDTDVLFGKNGGLTTLLVLSGEAGGLFARLDALGLGESVLPTTAG